MSRWRCSCAALYDGEKNVDPYVITMSDVQQQPLITEAGVAVTSTESVTKTV